jgi:Xylanase inhibitor C-terminal
VILDTVITATLLETIVYAKVKMELMKLGQSYSDTTTGLEVCYSKNHLPTSWPNLTLFFPSVPSSSVGAQMVLTKTNYVVTDSNTGAECAAIFEAQGASVIGIMAQISRQMLFNLSGPEPRLFFAQYSSSAFSVFPSVNMILIWSLSALLYLYILV